MKQKQLLEKFGHLIGKPISMADGAPDRIITKILHVEPDGKLCVETGDLHAFEFWGKEWIQKPHVDGAVKGLGPCERRPEA